MTGTRVPPQADRDFTASCYILSDNHVLLLKHGSLDLWLPPGGHIEERETPDEAALREVTEETGLQVEILPEFIPEKTEEGHNLPEPFAMNLHKIRDGHWHCNFAFVARPVSDEQVDLENKHQGFRWFDSDDLAGLDDIPDHERESILEALDHSGI